MGFTNRGNCKLTLENFIFLCILKLLFKDLMNAHERTISRIQTMLKFDFHKLIEAFKIRQQSGCH